MAEDRSIHDAHGQFAGSRPKPVHPVPPGPPLAAPITTDSTPPGPAVPEQVSRMWDTFVATLPTMQLPELWHLGTLNPEDKSRQYDSSYEGAGLSVSSTPTAWRRIARLGGAPQWRASRSSHAFLDFHALTDAQRETIQRWGSSHGLVEPVTRWTVTYFDDEVDADVTFAYLTEEEAQSEADNFDTEVQQEEAWAITQRLADRTGWSPGSTENTLHLLSTVFVEDMTTLDGVYWDDDDDGAWSAPRAVILPSRISEWHFTREP